MSMTEVTTRLRTHIRATVTWWIFGSIMAVAAVLRFAWIGSRPGHEWDEPVYANIASHVANGDGVMLKAQFGEQAAPYLSHPPFYFWLLGGWFKLFGEGITQARVLGALGALVALALVFLWLKSLKGPEVALLGTALLAIDGWIVFTNRVSWIENTQLILIVLALWAYSRAFQSESVRWFAIAGVAVGAVIVYKQIGMFVLLAVGLNWLIQRRQGKNHVVLAVSAGLVIALYTVIMTLVYWQDGRSGFLEASLRQLQRMTYLREARGTVVSIGDVIGAATGQYIVFIATMVVAFAAFVVLAVRVWACLKEKSWMCVRENSLLFSLALTSLVFFGLISLKMPHYFVLLLIPLFLFFASEVVAWWHADHEMRKGAVAFGVAILVALSIGAFCGRFIAHDAHSDSALQQATSFVATNVPVNAVVVADEPVGAAIPQPYCKPERTRACGAAVQYVVTYESRTEYLSRDPSFVSLIQLATPMAVFSGFKEEIVVWRMP